MPDIDVVFFQDSDGSVPVLEWIRSLIPKARIKCVARIKRLKERGHELRRPEADYLRDDIYELRVGLQGVNYRMLYFFHDQQAAVVSHGLTKEREVPPKEIELAITRMKEFKANPQKHTYVKELESNE